MTKPIRKRKFEFKIKKKMNYFFFLNLIVMLWICSYKYYAIKKRLMIY